MPSTRLVDDEDSTAILEDEIASHTGSLTPRALMISRETSKFSWHFACCFDASVIDFSNVTILLNSCRASTRSRAASISHCRGVGRSSFVPKGGRGCRRNPQGSVSGQDSSLPPSDGCHQPKCLSVPGTPAVRRSLLGNYANSDLSSNS